jgi:hypothetical protein
MLTRHARLDSIDNKQGEERNNHYQKNSLGWDILVILLGARISVSVPHQLSKYAVRVLVQTKYNQKTALATTDHIDQG